MNTTGGPTMENTDLSRLLEWLESVGITAKAERVENPEEMRGFRSRDVQPVELRVTLGEDDPIGSPIEGYSGFVGEFRFDESGKFIAVGFWE